MDQNRLSPTLLWEPLPNVHQGVRYSVRINCEKRALIKDPPSPPPNKMDGLYWHPPGRLITEIMLLGATGIIGFHGCARTQRSSYTQFQLNNPRQDLTNFWGEFQHSRVLSAWTGANCLVLSSQSPNHPLIDLQMIYILLTFRVPFNK